MITAQATLASRILPWEVSRLSGINKLTKLITIAWIIASEGLKLLYVSTCDCQNQPFSSWFFQAFQHQPYTFWWTYHGITWLTGPYSLLWWLLNSPAILGYTGFFAYLLALDLLAFWLLSRKSTLYSLYYLGLSLWFVTVDPVDFFIIIFAVAGRYSKWVLALAPLTKLPIGAPLWVWTWAFTNTDSLHGPENYGRYLILGSVWLFSLLLLVNDKTHALTHVHHQLSALNPLRSNRPAQNL